VSATVGGLWIVFFRPSALWGTAVYALIVAAFGAFCVLQARRSIKGMSNEELFR